MHLSIFPLSSNHFSSVIPFLQFSTTLLFSFIFHPFTYLYWLLSPVSFICSSSLTSSHHPLYKNFTKNFFESSLPLLNTFDLERNRHFTFTFWHCNLDHVCVFVMERQTKRGWVLVLQRSYNKPKCFLKVQMTNTSGCEGRAAVKLCLPWFDWLRTWIISCWLLTLLTICADSVHLWLSTTDPLSYEILLSLRISKQGELPFKQKRTLKAPTAATVLSKHR